MPRTILSKFKQDPDFFRNFASKNQQEAKAKKAKYKRISFKITDVQKEALDAICKRQRTTPVRFLKAVIKKHTAKYRATPPPVSYVTENQLQLFDLDSLK